MDRMDHRDIYANHAAAYDRLVGAEDCDGALLPALRAVAPVEGRDVLEVGAGTGRITRLLAAAGARVVGFDRSPAMIEVARRHLETMGADTCRLGVADARHLPVPSGWADLAVAGWVFGHFRSWFPETWRDEVGQALGEMARALRPGGTLVVVETLGTGSEVPRPPTERLAEYFRWLEEERGFRRAEIRTDYRFAQVEEAAEVTGFFFGEEFAARVRREQWTRVPECTGVWSLTRR